MAGKSQSIRKREILPLFANISVAFHKHAVTSAFRGGKGAPTYKRDVLYGGLRAIVSEVSTEQGQFFTLPTEAVYKQVCRMRRQKPDIVDLGRGAKGLWIGSREAKYVMLYFHGGGYIIGATHGHMMYQFELQKTLKKWGHSFAILSLAYNLAPEAIYPIQLAQAALGLKYLLEIQQRHPSSVILAGDSAGGNLASALLLHLAQPHPSGLVPRISLSSPLSGVLMISPWISFATSSSSFKSNAQSDYITAKAVKRASEAYLGAGYQHDHYTQPINAPPEYWKNVFDCVVSDAMIWAGGGEVLIDEISTFATMMEDALTGAEMGSPDSEFGEDWPLKGPEKSNVVESIEERRGSDRFKFVVTEKAAHEQMILDRFFLKKKKGNGGEDIEHWLRSVLDHSDRLGRFQWVDIKA